MANITDADLIERLQNNFSDSRIIDDQGRYDTNITNSVNQAIDLIESKLLGNNYTTTQIAAWEMLNIYQLDLSEILFLIKINKNRTDNITRMDSLLEKIGNMTLANSSNEVLSPDVVVVECSDVESDIETSWGNTEDWNTDLVG